MDDLQEATIKLFFGSRIFKGAVGDSVKQWEVGSRVLFSGRLSRNMDQHLTQLRKSSPNSQQFHKVWRRVERSLESHIDSRTGIRQQAR